MSLSAADLDRHATLGIDAELLERAGVRRVTDREARELLGLPRHRGDLAGVVYPRLSPATGRPVGYRVRRDNPEVEGGKPKAKYLSSLDRAHLYFTPEADALLGDVSAPLVVVESEKSALALTAAALRAGRRALAIALGGAWGWKGRIGKTTSATGARVDEHGPSPDLDLIAWRDRDVVIVLDGDARTNRHSGAARRALAAELLGRAARVRIVDLPIEPGVNGPDDYIGKHGAAAFWTLVDTATSATAQTSASKPKPEKPKQGREVQLEDPEPWPSPVDGAVLLVETTDVIRRHVILSPAQADAAALWIAAAHVIDGLNRMPMLLLSSPLPECGKTTAAITMRPRAPPCHGGEPDAGCPIPAARSVSPHARG